MAHSFSELFRSLNVQEHCFSLGPTSRLLALELASMPEARARHKVSKLASEMHIYLVQRLREHFLRGVGHSDHTILGVCC